MQITKTAAIAIVVWTTSVTAVTTFTNSRCLAQGGAPRTNNWNIDIDGTPAFHADLSRAVDAEVHQQCQQAIPPVGNEGFAGPNDAWMCIYDSGPIDDKGDPEWLTMGWSDNPGCQCRVDENTQANPAAGCTEYICDGC